MRKIQNLFASSMLALALVAVPLISGCGGEESESNVTQGAVINPDFDITGIGIFGGLPYIQVAGTAGRTQPASTSTDIYAYVYFTDKGVYAIASHNGKDSSSQIDASDRRWHSHKITLDAASCLTSIVDAGVPQLYGNKATLVYNLILTFNKALTVKLSTVGGKTCVTQVFDSFTK